MLLSVHWPAFYFWYGLIISPCLWASIGVRCSYSRCSFLSALATGKCTIIHVFFSLVITKSDCLKYGRVIWNHLLVNKQARTITSNKFIPIWLYLSHTNLYCVLCIHQATKSWEWDLTTWNKLKSLTAVVSMWIKNLSYNTGSHLIFIISVGATVAYTYLACLSKVQESRGVVP